jgi:hypothetical protein
MLVDSGNVAEYTVLEHKYLYAVDVPYVGVGPTDDEKELAWGKAVADRFA